MWQCLERWYRNLIFWGGDVRRISHFPYITWDSNERLLPFDETHAALPLIQAGDIGLHREVGFLANLAIPGFMKHAWIHVNAPTFSGSVAETHQLKIVEAISEGVQYRSPFYPLTDLVMILRPRVSAAAKQFAVEKAKKIIGCAYDYHFRFDIEGELERYDVTTIPEGATRGFSRQKDRIELCHVANNLSEGWNGGFTCTEVVAFAYWHVRDLLGIYRQKARGKMVVLPDCFINKTMDIVWVSSLVTMQAAKKLGLHPEGLAMLDQYLATQSFKPPVSPRDFQGLTITKPTHRLR